MNDFEIFCVLIKAMRCIGKIEDASLNKSGNVSVEGSLSDGRTVHLFVMTPRKED